MDMDNIAWIAISTWMGDYRRGLRATKESRRETQTMIPGLAIK